MKGTTRVAQIAAWPGWGLPEWPRWLPGHDENYQSGPDGYMAKMGTTRLAQMAAWPNRGFKCGPDGQNGDYQSDPDGCMAKMGTTRVAQMATWT